MERFLGRYASYIYALLRIVTGFLFIWHGTQKFFGYPPAQAAGNAPPPSALDQYAFMLGGGIELIGGLMIMFGFFAGLAAFIASGEMAVAYFWKHFALSAFLPLQNRGELAVLYCFVFLYIAARGSGVWSIDSLRGAGANRL
jgi:putative oxidoreductase